MPESIVNRRVEVRLVGGFVDDSLGVDFPIGVVCQVALRGVVEQDAVGGGRIVSECVGVQALFGPLRET